MSKITKAELNIIRNRLTRALHESSHKDYEYERRLERRLFKKAVNAATKERLKDYILMDKRYDGAAKFWGYGPELKKAREELQASRQKLQNKVDDLELSLVLGDDVRESVTKLLEEINAFNQTVLADDEEDDND